MLVLVMTTARDALVTARLRTSTHTYLYPATIYYGKTPQRTHVFSDSPFPTQHIHTLPPYPEHPPSPVTPDPHAPFTHVPAKSAC